MSKKKKLPDFVPLFKVTLDSAAWRAMSHGARSLYLALRRRHNYQFNNNGKIFLSQRAAVKEVGSGFEEITRWYQELQYYGFIVMTQPGCLGVNGKGRAPHWRLTDTPYQYNRATHGHDSEPGLGDGGQPTRDFLRWNGVRFSKHRAGGDHLAKTEPRSGKPEHFATENRSTRATENRSTSGKKCYGKPEHTARQSATENRSISSMPLHSPLRGEDETLPDPTDRDPAMAAATSEAVVDPT